jgi:signal transduction histidine kinase
MMNGEIEDITTVQMNLSAMQPYQPNQGSYQPNENYSAYYQVVEELQCYRGVGAIAQRLRQSLDHEAILSQTVEAVRHLLTLDGAVIYEFLDGESMMIAAESALSIAGSRTGFMLDAEMAQNLIATFGQISLFIIDDLSQGSYPSEIHDLLTKQSAKSALITLIQGEEDLWGVICAYQTEQNRHWKTFEAEALQQLAKEVAIALQQATLYQEAKSLHDQINQQTAELKRALAFESVLKRITDKVRDSLDENQILQAAVEELTLGLNLGGCNASLYDLSEGTSTIRYEYIHSIPTYRGRVAQMANSPEIYCQLQAGHYFQFCSLLPNPDRGRVATLACPIFVDPQSAQGMEETVLGDLWLIHHENHIFNEFEIRLVEQVASQCAIAIRQARLYQASQVQVQELEKLNRLKDEFLSTVSHELRTPIANFKVAIKMLRVCPSEEKRQMYLDILDKESIREAELINDLLDLQRLEATSCPIDRQPIHLQEWLPNIIQPFQTRVQHRKQSLQVDCPEDLPILYSDVIILQRILAELLNNACKYTAPGGQITLSIGYRTPAEDAMLSAPIAIFTVCNQADIPKEELPKLFDKFYRCPNADPWSQGGTGLGLALVQKLVGQLMGAIAVESKEGWTRFTVHHPI